MRLFIGSVCVALALSAPPVHAEPYHEPQVRYILADIQLGGSVDYYGKWAKEENDPDSKRAVKEWQAGTRVQNIVEFERKTVEGKHGKGMRIVHKGTNRTIDGMDIVLTKDLTYRQADVRYHLADLTLGLPVTELEARKGDASAAEALSRFADGVRAANLDNLEVFGLAKSRQLVYKGTKQPIDGALVKLNSDTPYPEAPVRYILADISLGGSADFYRRVYDTSHDPISLEALARWDTGYKITNLDEFERKKVNGKTLITYKGTDKRIDGKSVKLSSDR